VGAESSRVLLKSVQLLGSCLEVFLDLSPQTLQCRTVAIVRVCGCLLRHINCASLWVPSSPYQLCEFVGAFFAISCGCSLLHISAHTHFRSLNTRSPPSSLMFVQSLFYLPFFHRFPAQPASKPRGTVWCLLFVLILLISILYGRPIRGARCRATPRPAKAIFLR